MLSGKAITNKLTNSKKSIIEKSNKLKFTTKLSFRNKKENTMKKLKSKQNILRCWKRQIVEVEENKKDMSI